MKEPSHKNRYVIGADIGGSHISSAIVDLNSGKILGERHVTPVDSQATASEILRAWADNILESLTSAPADITAAGIALPGPFDYRNGVSEITGVGKYESIYGLDVSLSLGALLREHGIRELRFVNDASAFALGECLGGACRGDDRVVALTLGTGVGSGFVSGHRLVDSGDEVPRNGWVYCLAAGERIADDVFSTRGVCRRYRELTGESAKGVKEIAARYDSDVAVRSLFDEYGADMARFVMPLLKRFDSHTLLLGGNISRSYPLFGPALRDTLRTLDCNYPAEVRITRLHDMAALAGAASLFLDK